LVIGVLQQDVLQHSSTSSNHSSANVVVLSQPPVMVPMSADFHDTHAREEIVYGSEFLHADLDHEEIAHNISNTQRVQEISTSDGFQDDA